MDLTGQTTGIITDWVVVGENLEVTFKNVAGDQTLGTMVIEARRLRSLLGAMSEVAASILKHPDNTVVDEGHHTQFRNTDNRATTSWVPVA